MSRRSQRVEQDELRTRMRAVGMTHDEIAIEFARRYRLRPRAAHRVAHGWTQQQAADHVNAHAVRVGIDADGIAAMTAPRLSELENWPVPLRRRPTPQVLALLAEVYGTDIHSLVDLDDREHFDAADMLLISRSVRTAGPRPSADDSAGQGALVTLSRAPGVLPRPRDPHDPLVTGPGTTITFGPSLRALAETMLSASPSALSARPPAGQIAGEVVRLWRLRQQSRYQQLSAELPRALAAARNPDNQRGEIAGTAALVHLYNTASSFAGRLGSPELAAIAADRAVQAADITEDPLLRAAAAYRLANILLAAGQLGSARDLAVRAADGLRSRMTADRSHTATWGALLATASLATARMQAPAEAWELLGASRVAADILTTDHADPFAIFGPVNWLIHAVHVATDLGDGAQAIRRAEAVSADRLPAFLAERRTYLLLGTARGHVQPRDVDAALAALLTAEQGSPEELRHSPQARTLVSGLLTATPRRNDQLTGLFGRITSPPGQETRGR